MLFKDGNGKKSKPCQQACINTVHNFVLQASKAEFWPKQLQSNRNIKHSLRSNTNYLLLAGSWRVLIYSVN